MFTLSGFLISFISEIYLYVLKKFLDEVALWVHDYSLSIGERLEFHLLCTLQKQYFRVYIHLIPMQYRIRT